MSRKTSPSSPKSPHGPRGRSLHSPLPPPTACGGGDLLTHSAIGGDMTDGTGGTFRGRFLWEGKDMLGGGVRMRGRGNKRVECPEKAPPACESLGLIKRRIEAGSLQYASPPPTKAIATLVRVP